MSAIPDRLLTPVPAGLQRSPLLAFLIVLCAMLGGCAVAWVAPYDGIFDRQVAELHLKTGTFIARMSGSGGSYEANRTFYYEAEAAVEVLRSRAEMFGEKQNRGTLAILNDLQTAFEQMQEVHRAGPLKGNAGRALASTMQRHFKALEAVQLAKKRSLTHSPRADAVN
jgi:hypothetical protein